MGVTVHGGTMPGAVTPICSTCGVCLCWDIAESEYDLDAPFWDAWICQDCNNAQRLSLSAWRQERRSTVTSARSANGRSRSDGPHTAATTTLIP